MKKLSIRNRSYVWWNVAGIIVFVVGFLIGSIDMAIRKMSMDGGGAMPMTGGGTAMTIAGILQILGGAVAVVAFSLEMRRRLLVKRQERRLSTP